MSFNHALAMGNETDRVALLALKDQLVDGSSAGALVSWNASLHFCEWEGVRCGRQHQRVISLRLIGMKLGGSISPSIGNLSFLREANLSDNGLQGNIPREIGHLRRLRFLNLSQNNLQGNIPTELSNCSNLQVINLEKNSLSGQIPFIFGDNDMKNLTRLLLGANNLTGSIPSDLGNLSSLADIQLADNHFEGIIPDAIGRQSNLKILSFGGNSLSGTIPSSIYNLSSMTYIGMAGNKLSGNLAPEIGIAFPKLEDLHIGYNNFTGRIPRSVTNISSLKQIDISSNGFSGSVPGNMGNLKNLDLLAVDYNHLGIGKEGDLDFVSSLTNCSLLKVLIIDGNRLGGVLPDSVANLSAQLEYLYIGGTQISGSIPTEIGNLVKLTHIRIYDSSLTGNIPTSIGKLQNVGQFDLSMNRLSGNIPSSIGNLSQLLSLYLNDNNFEGRIPLRLTDCKSMEKMDLSRNKLGGSIKDQLGAGFENLIILNLSQNSFTGVFPSKYGMGGLSSSEGDIYSYGILLLEMITRKRPTDYLFHDGLSLHNFCTMALPEQLEEIVDCRLLQQINEKSWEIMDGERKKDGEMWECLVSFTKVGVACSVRVPTERMKIKDAITELLAIKARLHARNYVDP
ncbi:hypothetical protein PTKIN_Ptkin16aG0118300 [Pterospermum kingtungense]